MTIEEIEEALSRFQMPKGVSLSQDMPNSEHVHKVLLRDLNLNRVKISRYDAAIDEALNCVSPKIYRCILKSVIVGHFKDGDYPPMVVEEIVMELSGEMQNSSDRSLWVDPFGPRWFRYKSE